MIVNDALCRDCGPGVVLGHLLINMHSLLPA